MERRYHSGLQIVHLIEPKSLGQIEPKRDARTDVGGGKRRRDLGLVDLLVIECPQGHFVTDFQVSAELDGHEALPCCDLVLLLHHFSNHRAVFADVDVTIEPRNLSS